MWWWSLCRDRVSFRSLLDAKTQHSDLQYSETELYNSGKFPLTTVSSLVVTISVLMLSCIVSFFCFFVDVALHFCLHLPLSCLERGPLWLLFRLFQACVFFLGHYSLEGQQSRLHRPLPVPAQSWKSSPAGAFLDDDEDPNVYYGVLCSPNSFPILSSPVLIG